MRRLVKQVIAACLYYSGLLRFLVFVRNLLSAEGDCRILLYHRVVDPAQPRSSQSWLSIRSLPGIEVTSETFERHLRFLLRKYRVLSLRELMQILASGEKVPLRSVVITFDDGWRDNFIFALPLLTIHRISATIYLSTGFIGTQRLFWPEWLLNELDRPEVDRQTLLAEIGKVTRPTDQDRAYHRLLDPNCSSEESVAVQNRLIEDLKAVPEPERTELLTRIGKQFRLLPYEQCKERVMLTWEEIAEMASAGIDFGSHGVNHRIATKITREEFQREAELSLAELMAKVPSAIESFAYPNGDFDDTSVEVVSDTGYKSAVTVQKGFVTRQNNHFALPRINIHEGSCTGVFGRFSPAIFACQICNIF